jgi:16S rRNA (guanine527-N7)-methyltransferase
MMSPARGRLAMKPTSHQVFVSFSDIGDSKQIDLAMQDLEKRSVLLSVRMPPESWQHIRDFCRELAAYNGHTNLVSKADAPNLVREHIADSLTLVNLIKERDVVKTLVDIGSGAGFPGMILAFVLPDLHVTFIESVGKKARFLQQTCELLGLSERTSVLAARAETLARDNEYRDNFGFATARAVGSLAVVSELSLPFLRVGGFMFAQKSQKQADAEITEARELVTKLGGTIRDTVVPNAVAIGKAVAIIEVAKLTPTPLKYPRPTAQLQKSKKRS